MKYRFLNFELDTDRFDLIKNGERVDIQPQALAILVMLVQHHGHLVHKQHIFYKLWSGRSISASALSSQIKILRRILEDDGQKQKVIQTVYGRGLRFAAHVEPTLPPPVSITRHAPRSAMDTPVERVGKPPVIAILPLRKIGSMTAHSGLPEALPADITTALSQLRWLFVIARASSFRLAADIPNLAELREELGVDYVLTGSVELVGNDILVGIELNETRQHRVVWADRYDAPITMVHELRARIVRDIISAVDISISDTESSRTRLAAPDQLTAWESYHLGMSSVHGVNLDLETALGHFEYARQTSPSFSRAHAGSAYIHGLSLYHLARCGNETQAIHHMRLLGEEALKCDPLDPFAHLVTGRAERMGGKLDDALDHYVNAIALCPNYAEAYNSQAVVLMLKGDFAAAHDAAKLAIKLSPKCPMRFEAESTQAFVAFKLGKNEEALALASKLARLPQKSPLALLIAITIFHHLGFENEAHLLQKQVLSRGIEMRTNLLRTFPESAAEMSAQISQTVSHYFK